MTRPRILLPLLAAFALLSAPLVAGTLPAGFAETHLATGLDPTAMEFAPDGRLFILEKIGRVRVMKDDVLLETPFTTVPADNYNERGLSGIAFDPDFETNGYVYLYYTVLNGTPGAATHNRVVRVQADPADPDVALPGETTIFDLDAITSGNHVHMGGAMFFREGKLYIATGEAGSAPRSQSFTSQMGKVLRINPDGTIPTDNPFHDTTTGNNRAIYALGLRNPFSFAIQPGSGKVYLNDVGGHSGSYEEINELQPGANYGWPSVEGMIGTGQTPPAGYVDPLHAYPLGGHNSGYAIAGGVFYNPPLTGAGRFPLEYDGLYFFGDYVNRWVRTYNPATGEVLDFATDNHRPLCFRLNDTGAFYMLTRGASHDGSVGNNTSSNVGRVTKIVHTASNEPSIAADPEDTLASVGWPAEFTVSVSGGGPYEFRWQRDGVDIPGATVVSPSSTHTYTLPEAQMSDDGAKFRAVITNAGGTIESAEAVLSVTTRQPPAVTISSPSADSKYSGGQLIDYAGSAIDDVDGALDESALTWRVDFHHDDHTHPVLPEISGISGGSFTISNLDHGINVWYRIYLTATNSAGLSRTVYREILPRFVDITLATQPPGLRVKLDTGEHVTPYTYTGIAGMLRTIEAGSPQALDGSVFSFDNWSDGGAASHEMVTPETDATFTATFIEEPAAGIARDYWLDLPGTSIAQLTADPRYPGSPTGSGVVSSLTGPMNWADNYGARYRGLLTPPSNGDYTFHLSGSDEAEFWLSTDASAGNAMQVANVADNTPLAYEGFDYPTGGIGGRGGANDGWVAAWTGSGTVVEGGLTYTDANGKTLPVSGNRIEVIDQAAFRRTTWQGSGTLWLSFIAHAPASVPWAGVALFEGSGGSDGTERLFLGQRSGTTVWGIEHKVSGNFNSTFSSANQALLVYRIDFGAPGTNTTNIYLWVDPPLGAANEPAIGTQTGAVLDRAHFQFDRVRIACGATTQGFRVDELRLGTSYAQVAPDGPPSSQNQSDPIALDSGQSYYFELLHKAGVGNDHVSVNWSGPGIVDAPIAGAALAPLPYSPPDLTTFEGWRQIHFQGALGDESRSGFNGDFNNDGIPNGVAYALGLDPTVFDPDGLPQGRLEDGVLTLVYRRDNSLDISYEVVASPTLGEGTWSSDNIVEAILDSEGSVEVVKATLTVGDSEKHFMRLKVELEE